MLALALVACVAVTQASWNDGYDGYDGNDGYDGYDWNDGYDDVYYGRGRGGGGFRSSSFRRASRPSVRYVRG